MKPKYSIDMESVARQPQGIQLALVLLLVDKLAHPDWSRDGACGGCLNWRGTAEKPFPLRPFAHFPATTCNGCAFSHLDEVRRRCAPATQTVASGVATDLVDQAEEMTAGPTLAADAKRRPSWPRLRDRLEPVRTTCPKCDGPAILEEFSSSDEGGTWKRVIRCRRRELAKRCKASVEVVGAAPEGLQRNTLALTGEQIRWRAGRHICTDTPGRRAERDDPPTVRLVPGLFRRLWLEAGHNRKRYEALLAEEAN